jgi:hypothetical protein
MDVLQPIILVASAFDDPNTSDTHLSSQWLISSVSGAEFNNNLLYNSGTFEPTILHAPAVSQTKGTTYYWKVRYQDSKGEWSVWSDETSFATAAILPGTIGYFRLDEGSGLTTENLAGTIAGTLAPNTPTWTTDSVAGNALYFDGSGNELYWNYSDGIPANTFTIEASVKTSTTHSIDAESQTGIGGTSGQRYLFWPNYPGDSTYTLFPGDRFVDAGMGISLGTNGISIYEHGNGYMPAHAVYSGTLGTDWNHVTIVFDNKRPFIYLNGILVHTGIQSTRGNVYAPIRLGYGQYGDFEGTVDEVVLYDRALDATEVRTRCEDSRGVGQCN